MRHIENLVKDDFYEKIPTYWKNDFLEDSAKYETVNALKWFFLDDVVVGGVRVWKNSDHFDIDWIAIIDQLLDQGYNKLSYFFMNEDKRWYWYWALFLKDIIADTSSYYLTCSGEKLKKYYKDLWFSEVYSLADKHIMVFGERADTRVF